MRVHVLLFSASALLLGGCQTMATTSATTTGVAVAEERTIGNSVDDAAIYAQITHYFIQSDSNDLLINVNVRSNEGRVLLTGSTTNNNTAIEAVRLAWLAEGVKEVINEIQITDQNGVEDYAKDSLIETQLETRLLLTKNIKSINYTVEVVNGIVYLLGVGQNEEEVRNVAYIASITKGVKKVVSYVRLKDDPRRVANGARPST